jgi:hypothetical protein
MDAASVSAEPSHLISNTHKKHEYHNNNDLPPLLPDHGLQGIGKSAADRGMTLDERAIMLAAAVSIDFDYFSRHSSGHGAFLPFGVFDGNDYSSYSSDG